MEERYKSKIIVDLLMEGGEEKILMLLRQNTGHWDGYYDLPGGHIEKGEDLLDGMIREAKEEIGIDIKRADLRIIHIYHNYDKDAIKFVLRASNYQGNLVNAEPELSKKIKWIDINKLPENIVPVIRKELENIKNKIYYSAN